MKCFNSFCPFRVNESSDENNCVCEYCPNRVKTKDTYASDRTIVLDRNRYCSDRTEDKYRGRWPCC